MTETTKGASYAQDVLKSDLRAVRPTLEEPTTPFVVSGDILTQNTLEDQFGI